MGSPLAAFALTMPYFVATILAMTTYDEATGNMPHANLTDWDAVKALTDADIIHDDDSPATTESDWGQAFVSHSAIELHTEVAHRIASPIAIDTG